MTLSHFQSFPNLKDGQFRREGNVFHLKEASQERKKNNLHLLNDGTPVAITILQSKFPLAIPTFYRLTNSAIISYCKKKSSDFCL